MLRNMLTVKTLTDTVRDLKALPPNWDGYGALTIDHACIDRAVAIIATIEPASRAHLAPSVNGGALIAWTVGPIEIEIGVEPDGTLSVLVDVDKVIVTFEDNPCLP